MERKAKAESAKSEPKGRASKKGGQDGTTSAEDNKRKREDDDMIEEFTVRMHDVLGNERLTLFGADALNAINYTMERVPFRRVPFRQLLIFLPILGWMDPLRQSWSPQEHGMDHPDSTSRTV